MFRHLRKLFGQEECPLYYREAYAVLYRNIIELESLHHRLPNDSETEQGKIVVEMEYVDNLAKWMLERTTCIQKEIALQMRNCRLFYLVDNPHIMEEIELLQKDLRILKSAYERWKKTK